MSLEINTSTAMNIPQHYPKRKKSVRTLTSDNHDQAAGVAQGKKLRCPSLSPVGEKQVITPSKAIAAARGRKNRRKYPNSVGVQHLSASCCTPTEYRVIVWHRSTPSCGYRLARGYSHFTPSAYAQNTKTQ